MKVIGGGCPRGVMVKVMDCGIVVREFVLYTHAFIAHRGAHGVMVIIGNGYSDPSSNPGGSWFYFT